MAVFYVLPPRLVLGECIARMLRPYVPGVTLSQDSCADLVESLVMGAPDAEEAYVVYREELPDGADLNESLRGGFGAEVDDQVIHVCLGPKPDEPRVRTWKLEAA